MQLSNRAYDVLKYIALVALPALATFYGTLALIWGLPLVEEVVGTIVAVDTLLGMLLHLTAKQYNNNPANYEGELTSNGVDPDTGIPNLQLTVTTDPNEILAGKVARLKVK